MSRSAVIIYCHFLVLGLFALATLDWEGGRSGWPANEAARVDPEIVDVLKQSLEEEHAAREQLRQELAQAQDALHNRDRLLASGDARTREALASLQRTETEARQLADSRAALEQQRVLLEAQLAAQRTNLTALEQRAQASQAAQDGLQRDQATLRNSYQQLQQGYEAARAEVARLEQRLAVAASEAKVSAEVMSVLQEDLRKQVAISGQLQEQLQGSRKLPSGKEKRSAREPSAPPLELQLNQGEQLRFEQQAARLLESPAPLGNVSAPSASPVLRSTDRPGESVASEAILNELNANRIQATFQAKRSGLFRQTVRKDTVTKPILLAHGTQVFALFHVEDTPLALEPFRPDWEGLSGTLGRQAALFSITQVAFLDRDPRIVIVPLGLEQAVQLGCKVFPAAVDPSRYEEVILVGNARSYYGEAKLQPDPAHANYVRLPRERFSRVSSKFAPARGDLLMSRTGEVLGIMVNKEYGLLLDAFDCTRAISTGANFQQPAPLLAEMYQQVMGLPHRLQ